MQGMQTGGGIHRGCTKGEHMRLMYCRGAHAHYKDPLQGSMHYRDPLKGPTLRTHYTHSLLPNCFLSTHKQQLNRPCHHPLLAKLKHN